MTHLLICEWPDDGSCKCILCGKVTPDCRPNLYVGCEAKKRGKTFVSRTPATEAPQDGPGTELKAMLAAMGFHTFKGCACNSAANAMNLCGPAECRQPHRKRGILEILAQHAKKAGVTVYDDTIGEALIEEACRRAEEKT